MALQVAKEIKKIPAHKIRKKTACRTTKSFHRMLS